jgi:type IV secretory pathway TrbL component
MFLLLLNPVRKSIFIYIYYILKQHPTENSGSSTSSAGSTTTSSGGSGNYGTLGRNANGGQPVMASMMDEMARTLARRRAAVEKKEPIECPQVI